MQLLTFREELETLLADLLGTYTLANGAEVPAVSVRNTGELSPAGTVVSGLELIIQRNPRLKYVERYDTPLAFRLITVFLVSWDGSDPTPAADLIVNAYPNAVATEVTTIDVPEGLGPQAQMRITLQFNPTPVEAAA